MAIVKFIMKSVIGGKNSANDDMAGFSLIELMMSLVLTLIILGVAVAAFSGALSSRERETSKTDALNSAQAAINIMSREIGNAGYGLNTNGLGWLDINGVFQTDSTNKRLHFRANTDNSNLSTTGPGEDVTFYYDAASQSVVRYDKNLNVTSGIINRVSDVDFLYYNYTTGAATTTTTTPAQNTGKVNITLTVNLANVQGQPTGQTVKFSSDVTLRNSTYMLGQY